MKLRKLCVSCGGTGGHFHPGVAVAREWQKQGGKVLLLLGGKHADNQLKTAAAFGLPVRKIAASPLSRHPLEFVRFCLTVRRGVRECRQIYREFRPDALLAMGSFASFPSVLAAKRLKIPLFLHDGNARPGRANLRLGSWAEAMALSFPTPEGIRCHCKTVLTGMPLRPELLQHGTLDKAAAVEAINRRWHAGFIPDRPTVLIFGGSLGAADINFNCRVPLNFSPDSLQLIHLTGLGKFAEVNDYYRAARFPHLILDASPEMRLFYSAADYVWCRAGGSTVSELACFGRCAVLIPYPFAAQDHQSDNARCLAASGGAEIIQNKNLSPEVFLAKLNDFLADPKSYREKGKRLKALAFPDAAARVLKMISDTLETRT